VSVSRLNAEGYHDPTAYEALTNWANEEKKKSRPYRPLVFICSPFAGDVAGNIERVRRFCRFAVRQGTIPVAPHLHYPQFMDDNDKEQRELGLFFGTVWLRKCDALWFFGDRISAGMKREIQAARRHGLQIKQFNDNLEEVLP